MKKSSGFLPQGVNDALKKFAKQSLGGLMLLLGIILIFNLFFYDPYLQGFYTASNFGEQGVFGNIIGFFIYSVGFMPSLFLFLCLSRISVFLMLNKQTYSSPEYNLFSGIVALFAGTIGFGATFPQSSFGGLLGSIVAADLTSIIGMGSVFVGILFGGLFFYIAGKLLNITMYDLKFIFSKIIGFFAIVISVFQLKKYQRPSITRTIKTKTVKKKKAIAAASKSKKETVKKVKAVIEAEPMYKLPPPEFLAKSATDRSVVTPELKMRAVAMENNFEKFGVFGAVRGIKPGPIVTLYEFEPDSGVRIAKITETVDDMMRAMATEKIRMAVIPKTNYIGIEMVNLTRQELRFQNLVTNPGFVNSKYKIPLALGVNIGGNPMYFDLAKMPHLMIAGRTGSGKSVFVQSIIMSILYKFTPDKCKLVIVDPKGVDFTLWEKIPHLMTEVLTDSVSSVNALKWSVREMEDRYKKLQDFGVQNIEGYNEAVAIQRKSGKPKTKPVAVGTNPETGELEYEMKELDLSDMPYLVIIIDEVADLMSVARKDVEACVQRLAQKARAAGIHLVMATQRPSADVITGVIKANFPTRISFQARSNFDSITTLGEKGAEQLLSCGDMLFSEAGMTPVRIHGALIINTEINKVADFLRAQGEPEFNLNIGSDPSAGFADAGAIPGLIPSKGDKDSDLYEKAKEIVIRDKKPTISYLQRRLQIGYNKAATLIEKMEADGILSSPDANNKRQIL